MTAVKLAMLSSRGTFWLFSFDWLNCLHCHGGSNCEEVDGGHCKLIVFAPTTHVAALVAIVLASLQKASRQKTKYEWANFSHMSKGPVTLGQG